MRVKVKHCSPSPGLTPEMFTLTMTVLNMTILLTSACRTRYQEE